MPKLPVRDAPTRVTGVDAGGLWIAARDDADVRLQMPVGEGDLLAAREVLTLEQIAAALSVSVVELLTER